MKKRKVFGLVVAGLLAGFVSSAVAQSATAYSSTAVGVIKKTLPAKAYSFISLPLDPTSGDNTWTFSDTPLATLPVNSRVMVWDVTNSVWTSASRSARDGWGDFANYKIQIGQPLFVYNYSTSPIEIVFSGEVPETDQLSVALPGKGYQTVANPYPVPMVWGDSDIATNSANNSRVMIWDADKKTWLTQSKSVRDGWGTFATNVIEPGQGMFVYEYGANGYTWTVDKPYQWP